MFDLDQFVFLISNSSVLYYNEVKTSLSVYHYRYIVFNLKNCFTVEKFLFYWLYYNKCSCFFQTTEKNINLFLLNLLYNIVWNNFDLRLSNKGRETFFYFRSRNKYWILIFLDKQFINFIKKIKRVLLSKAFLFSCSNGYFSNLKLGFTFIGINIIFNYTHKNFQVYPSKSVFLFLFRFIRIILYSNIKNSA